MAASPMAWIWLVMPPARRPRDPLAQPVRVGHPHAASLLRRRAAGRAPARCPRGAPRSATRASRRRSTSASRRGPGRRGPRRGRRRSGSPARWRPRPRRRACRRGPGPAAGRRRPAGRRPGTSRSGPGPARRRPGRGRRRRPRPSSSRPTASMASASSSAVGGGTWIVTSRVAVSYRTPSGVPSAVAAGRRRRSGSSAPKPPRASAAWLAHRAWWSCAQMLARRPGATRSRSSAVGQPPQRSLSQPWPSSQASGGSAAWAAASRSRPSARVAALGQVDLAGGHRGLGQVQVRVGQAGDGDLVGLQPDASGERIGPGLEVDLRPGEGDPAVADADGLHPAEAVVAGERRDATGEERVERHGSAARVGRRGPPARGRRLGSTGRDGSVGAVDAWPAAASRAASSTTDTAPAVNGSSRRRIGRGQRARRRVGIGPPARQVRAEGGGDGILGVRVGRRPDGRRAWAGGTGRCATPETRMPRPTTRMTAVVPDDVRDRADDDDRQEARHRHEHVQDAEDAAADLLREVLLELGLGRDGDQRRRRCRRRTR